MSNYSTIQKDQLKKLGSYLKETREEQGKSIEEISLQTYIRPQLIMRIEAGDSADLPQPIFVQGFIRRYADALGLDGMKLSRQFPVHSIPDTPRPTPRPAIPTAPLGKSTIPPKPTESTVPSEKIADPWADPVAAGSSVETADTAQAAKDTVLTGDLPDLSSPPKPVTNGVKGGAKAPMAVPSPNTSPTAPSLSVPSMSGSNGWGADVPRSQPYNESSNKVPYILAGVLAALVVGAIALLTNLPGGNKPQPTEQTETAPAPEAVVETAPAPEPEPEPEPEPANPTANSTAPVAVSVSLTDASWMRIAIDGNVVFADTMEAGAEELYEAQESIYIRAGNAGAVTLSHNGSPPEIAGAPGAIEDLYFTPEAAPDEAAE
ncbi:MAG: helix-turn-helix domain-containing protein [Cyanobacteria bacterium P01_D01_bin.44]